MDKADIPAPDWQVSRWFNGASLRLADLRGKVVVLHAFQMLCPGCVVHGLPQAQRIHEAFRPEEVAVIGLHTVFEHHEAMNDTALAAFIHEFRYGFPIGVDQTEPGHGAPLTMRRYGLRGTPSLVLIDGTGRIRYHSFGRDDDLRVGARIAALLGGSTGLR
ncbi:MAG: peroxiredoxin family protein [Gammaproteobacteria bacterium]